MGLFLLGFFVGGLSGVVLACLCVAAGDADRRPRLGSTTRYRSRELGQAWIIAGNGTQTVENR